MITDNEWCQWIMAGHGWWQIMDNDRQRMMIYYGWKTTDKNRQWMMADNGGW